MENKYIQNAKITHTLLGGIEKGPCFCVELTLELSEGDGVCFGGFALDKYSDATRKRVATRIGLQVIMDIMETLGVNSWEEIKGKYIRAEFDSPSAYGHITRIGHLMENKWFSFEECFKKWESSSC